MASRDRTAGSGGGPARCGRIAAVAAFLLLATAVPGRAQGAGESGALSRGIALYTERKNEQALVELRRAMESDRTRVLALYYSARIRLRLGQFATARKNLLAALADSSDFHDATGLLAWTNVKLGNTTDALIEWRRFVEAAGGMEPGAKITERSIILPESYRERIAAARPDTVPAQPDSLAATPPADTVRTAAATVGRPDSAGPGAALTDLDHKLESQIRRGYYGIGAAAALLLAGLAGTVWWLRKRRKTPAGPDFLAEVDRMLEPGGERDEFALGDEELSARELRRRVRELRDEPPASPATPFRLPPEPPARVPAASFPEPSPEPEPAFPDYTGPAGDGEDESVFRPEPPSPSKEPSRRVITEEVKALVTRLHREGRGTVDIARIADLTRTEVELIVAVRARNMEQLIQSASRESDASGSGAFRRAVAELSAEGRDTVEIARRLGVSTSEVTLALAIMGRDRRR